MGIMRNPDRGLFHCKAKCMRCDDRRRLCMWVLEEKGWLCWKCAGVDPAGDLERRKGESGEDYRKRSMAWQRRTPENREKRNRKRQELTSRHRRERDAWKPETPEAREQRLREWREARE